MKKLNERIVFGNGSSISIQADKEKYCSPRMDNSDFYSSVEIGYPEGHILIPEGIYFSGEVAGFVDVCKIAEMIKINDGIVSGQLPPMEGYRLFSEVA